MIFVSFLTTAILIVDWYRAQRGIMVTRIYIRQSVKNGNLIRGTKGWIFFSQLISAAWNKTDRNPGTRISDILNHCRTFFLCHIDITSQMQTTREADLTVIAWTLEECFCRNLCNTLLYSRIYNDTSTGYSWDVGCCATGSTIRCRRYTLRCACEGRCAR